MEPAPITDRLVKIAQGNINLFWGTYFGKTIPDASAGSTPQKKMERDKLLDYVRQQDGEGALMREVPVQSWSEHGAKGATKTVCYGLKVRQGDLEANIDQLSPNDDGSYDLVMSRAVANPKDYHYTRLAFQKHVLEQSGVRVRSCHFWMLNPGYGKDGDDNLMCKQNVSGAVTLAEKSLPDLLAGMRKAMASPEARPNAEYCAEIDEPSLPPHHVFTLTQGRKKPQLAYARGIRRLADWPDDIPLSPTQEVQVRAAKTGQVQINRNALNDFFQSLKHPLHFLDFETCAPAVPLYPGISPFETVPFMFANFKSEKPEAEPVMDVFLAEPGQDPRKALMLEMKASLQGHGSIVVFSKAMESNVLKSLARDFPAEKAWLDKADQSLVDLYSIFRSFHFHHPDQTKSSLKSLLDNFLGVRYDKLVIRDGSMAEESWLVMHEEKDAAKVKALQDGLKVYCAQDASGMALVLKFVQDTAQAKPAIETEALSQVKTIPRTKSPEEMAQRKGELQAFAAALKSGDIPTF
jgi:hypothetical protein